MSIRRVQVTYSAPLVFLQSDSWNQIRNAFQAQLPLHNLHWRSSNRPLRTIQQLHVDVVALDSVRDELVSQVPQTLLEKPFLNIYVTTCEDLDSYKSTAKKQIKDWHSSVTSRKNQEWLILHVLRPDARAHGTGFFQMKGSVLDKIRSDFNTEKKDRCVQLIWSLGNTNPTAWADLIAKLKDGLVAAFETAVAQREEEVRRSESQRAMPGWNFCTFFVLKESLAASFEGMNILEDALQQYDELEGSFFQVLEEKNLSWFGALIDPAPEDDALPLLSTTRKPYRDLILANTISVFDFRVYLLARQCGLLGKLGRVVEVGRKAVAFLGAFGRRLRGAEDTLPEYFLESWTYSSALSVVDLCDAWAGGAELDVTTKQTFNSVKAELLELARNQLDKLGIAVGHLPEKAPFSMSLSSAKDIFSPRSALPPAVKSTQKISREDLLKAIANKTMFYDLYVGVTNRAIELYAKAGRRKFALRLHGSLAALDFHRGRYESAAQTYTSLPAHYAPHHWNYLESVMLSSGIIAHDRLDKARDPAWMDTTLSYFRTFINNTDGGRLIDVDDQAVYIETLVKELQDAAKALDTGEQLHLVNTDHPAFRIQLKQGSARSALSEDGSFVDLEIDNRLRHAFPVDEVQVTLVGRDAEKLVFSSNVDSLAPGTTTLAVFCPTSSPGLYLLTSSMIRIARLEFRYHHNTAPAVTRLPTYSYASPTLVRIPKDPDALELRLSQPRRIQLGSSSQLLVTVHSGRNHLLKAALRLSTTSTIKFQHSKATCSGIAELRGSETKVTLREVPKSSVVDVLIPHSDASGFQSVKVVLDFEYTSASETTKARRLRLARVVTTALPLAVNVQDFFRGERIFSKFTVSTTTHQHVRISSARLEAQGEDSKNLTIVSPHIERDTPLTVTPTQQGSFVFQLQSSTGAVREPLLLHIQYRMLREEVEAVISEAVHRVTSSSEDWRRHEQVLTLALIGALEKTASWVELYGITGELQVPDIPEEDNFEIGEALRAVKKDLISSRSSVLGYIEDWREVIIPVDVPSMNVVAAAQLKLQPPSSSAPEVYAGQPVSTTLSIHTSFHWDQADTANVSRRYRMRFDVEELVRDWLISGQKRGDFEATDGGIHTFQLTLVALHHGELSLPSVSVTPLPVTGQLMMASLGLPSSETYQVHGAQKVLVLPRNGRSTYLVGADGIM